MRGPCDTSRRTEHPSDQRPEPCEAFISAGSGELLLIFEHRHPLTISPGQQGSHDGGALGGHSLPEMTWVKASGEGDFEAAPYVHDVGRPRPRRRCEALQNQGADFVGEGELDVECLAIEAVELEGHLDWGRGSMRSLAREPRLLRGAPRTSSSGGLCSCKPARGCR